MESSLSKITKIEGNKVTLEFSELPSWIKNDEILQVEPHDPRTTSPEQRKHFYALMGDYEEYTGTPLDAAESWFKYKFMQDHELDELPSLRNNAMAMRTTSELISDAIDYFIENGIPFQKQNFYQTTDISKMLFALTIKRLCWVCGKPNSDLAHVEAVGAGRNRRKIDHSKHHFMCLCREHHQEQHSVGLVYFMQKHHFKPIKLSVDNLKELKIQGNYEGD